MKPLRKLFPFVPVVRLVIFICGEQPKELNNLIIINSWGGGSTDYVIFIRPLFYIAVSPQKQKKPGREEVYTLYFCGFKVDSALEPSVCHKAE